MKQSVYVDWKNFEKSHIVFSSHSICMQKKVQKRRKLIKKIYFENLENQIKQKWPAKKEK